jgi:ResB-like family
MKRLWNTLLGLDVAIGLCCLLAVGSIVLACLGATRAGEWMSRLPNLIGVGLLALGVGVTSLRSIFRKRFHSALFHGGLAMILVGWLIGQYAIRTESREHPVTGLMALIDGDVSSELYKGSRLETSVGRVPFIVRLEKFVIERYSPHKTGSKMDVREYRSEVTIQEPGKPPRREDIRVNHPAYVQGFHIYQMSYGETQDRWGRPVTYTILQFIRDPGLYVVYTGFGLLFAGAFWFAARFFRLKKGVAT